MDETEEEVWKPMPAFPHLYEVSSLGRVRRSAPSASNRSYVGRLLKPHVNAGTGYLMAYAFADGRLRPVAIHRQVAIAFHGTPLPGQVARHLDDDKRNNTASNIAWGTQRDNYHDAIRNGRFPGRTVPVEDR